MGVMFVPVLETIISHLLAYSHDCGIDLLMC